MQAVGRIQVRSQHDGVHCHADIAVCNSGRAACSGLCAAALQRVAQPKRKRGGARRHRAKARDPRNARGCRSGHACSRVWDTMCSARRVRACSVACARALRRQAKTASPGWQRKAMTCALERRTAQQKGVHRANAHGLRCANPWSVPLIRGRTVLCCPSPPLLCAATGGPFKFATHRIRARRFVKRNGLTLTDC